MAEREIEFLREGLRRHVKALAVDIGPRTPFNGDSLERAAAYIQSAFEEMGLSVTEQPYQYYGQRVVNLLATADPTTKSSAYYVVGAHYDTVPTTPGADDNASAVAVMLELARRLPDAQLNVPVLFVAFTLEEPPAFYTGHQGSRVFVRNCQSKGDRVLGALILEMVGYTSPRQHYPFVSSLARLSYSRQLHRHYWKLALTTIWARSSEGNSARMPNYRSSCFSCL